MTTPGESEGKIWLRAFGVTEVGEAGADSAHALGMKAMAMIAYLADNAPRPVTRDRLVDLLWDRSAPAQGKGSLRQEIRRVKKTLGDAAFDAVFDVTDNHVAIRLDEVDYDVGAAIAAAEADDPDEIARLLDLYTGDYLADNSARSESFQQWAMERREFLKDLVIAALARLAFAVIDAGRVERAQSAADRIISIDGLHEKGHEIIIRCHFASGRRGQARAYYERLRALLLRELGAEPQQDITDLVNAGDKIAPAPKRGAEEPVKKVDDAPVIEPRGKPTVAVLNVSRIADKDQSYLAEGVVQQLVANLAKSSWIKVAALNPGPFIITDDNVDRSQRDLRGYADYILRLDIRVAGPRVAILAILNRVEDNETVFSDEMDDEVEDIIDLQRSIAIRIASIFEPVVLEDQSEKESQVDWSEPVDFDHWRLLMRANWLFWTTTRRNNLEAQALLGKALEIRAKDAPTHCLMAFSHMLDAWSDWVDDVDVSVEQAQRWAKKAVAISPNDGWAQFTLGVTCSTPDMLEQAISRVAHARRLSPSLAIASGELARLRVFNGETAEARALADEALRNSPYDQQSGLWVRSKAIAAWMDGDADEALELVDYALIVRPGWFQNHFLRAVILAEAGEMEKARDAWAGGAALVGDYSTEALRIAHPFTNIDLFHRFAAGLNKSGASFEV